MRAGDESMTSAVLGEVLGSSSPGYRAAFGLKAPVADVMELNTSTGEAP